MQQEQPMYRDHADAGSVLARSLVKYAGQHAVVLGVGLGGVAVAAPVADALGADLDVLVVRPLTLPGQPDRQWGAVAALGDCVQVAVDREADGRRHAFGESPVSVPKRDLIELRGLEEQLRDGRPPEPVCGRLVIAVGDGLGTVAAMRAASSAVRRHHPAGLVIALPAASNQTCRDLRKDADDVVCPQSLGAFRAFAPLFLKQVAVRITDVSALLSASWSLPQST